MAWRRVRQVRRVDLEFVASHPYLPLCDTPFHSGARDNFLVVIKAPSLAIGGKSLPTASRVATSGAIPTQHYPGFSF